MNRFFGKLAIVGLAVGFLSIMADGAFAKGPNPIRPYRIHSQETQTGMLCDAGGGVTGQEFVGQGNATHSGLTAIQGCVVFTPLSPTVLAFVGQGSSIAANGDVVYFDILDGVSDLVLCTATYTIVFAGGTGRFEEASGTAECTSTRPTCGFDQTTTCTGNVSY